VLRIARKRAWFLLLPLSIVSAGTAIWAHRLPDRYRSETTILVVPQRVPETYVRSTVTAKVEDRVNSMTAQILSRTRLEKIIEDFNLYEKEREAGALMQDVVERMRRDIRPDVRPGENSFRISYVGENARTVQQVTERLASLFINENLEDRTRMAQGTDQFLENELEDAKQRLVEQEKKVEDYKRRNAGQLPSQLESNLQVLQNAQMQIQAVLQSLENDRERRLRLEREIADLERQIEDPVSEAFIAGPGGSSPASQLDQLNDALSVMLLTKKDTHPDVRRLKAAIAELEAKINSQASRDETPVSPDLRRLSMADALRRKRLDDLKLDLNLIKRNIQNAEKEEQRLRSMVVVYQQRNEAIPTRETEMTELLRDYNTLQTSYNSLLAKGLESKMAANLESRQIGEQFRVLDPARRAERPFSPDRQQINIMGLASGLAIGLLLVALLEYRDKTFKTDEEVARVLELPVLAVVPLMHSAKEKQRLFRRQLVMGIGFGTTVLLCLAVVAYTLVR
jgi:polysaccharide chain length determinant protein (PEP-CTERM system associated)